MTAGIAANLGMAPTREAFAAASTEELVAARTRLASMSDGGGPVSLSRRFATGLLPFGPSPDGDLLPATPIERIAAGAGAAVPVLAGNTSQEFNITASRSAGDLDQTVLLDALGLPPAAAPDHVPQGSGLSAPALLGQALTDRTFRIPIVRAGEARFGAAASTYPYEFRWPAPGPGGLLGAGHCVDLPFVFDLLDAEGVATVADHDPPQGLADRGVQDDPLRDVRGIWAGVI
jgi:para-nitrobenzyl esterase